MADDATPQIAATEVFELCSTLIQLMIDKQLISAMEVAQRIHLAADRLAGSGLPADAAAAAHLNALAEVLAATATRQ